MQKLKNIIARVKGFTLIELLVVIAIIGILSSSVIISTNTARKKARDARRLADLKQIANAMEIYIDSNGGKYPDSLDALVPNYIAVLPTDPLTKANYPYCANGTAGGTNDGTTFHLGAAMEEYNPVYFDSDADLEVDSCENLPSNPSFNGYSEACSGTQKCNGANCDGCLDFTNIVGVPSDTGTGGNTGGNGGGGNCAPKEEIGTQWVARSAAGNNDKWHSVAYGNGLFVAVSYEGDRVMTSPDGINWTVRDAAGNNDGWYSVTYGNGLFVAVAFEGNDRVMTSPDGINWTARNAAGNNDSWVAVTYGNNIFVAVGLGGDRVMTSPDGVNWTARNAGAGNNDRWRSITYGNGKFVAAGDYPPDMIMTSPDGINWTVISNPVPSARWHAVTFGDNLFVMVGYQGDSVVMTSPDGVNWTPRDAGDGNNDQWDAIAYGSGLFVAVSYYGDHHVMTSPDGVNWTVRDAAGNDDFWMSVAYGNNMFVAVGNETSDRVMTSEKRMVNPQNCP